MLKPCVGLAALALLGAPLWAEVPGTQVAGRTQKVMSAYNWSSDLAFLKERAQKEKKLIFWLQLVGNLDGGL